MCLIVKSDINVKFGVANSAIVYKFMLQDPEGNLWSARYGGKMELDSDGFYHSDADGKRKYAEGAVVEKGLHVVLTQVGVRTVQAKFESIFRNIRTLAKIFCRKCRRPEGSRLVWTIFLGYKDDLIATGDSETLPVDQAVFTKLKYKGSYIPE